MGRPGLLGWVAIGSSLLIIPVVVLLGTYVITPHGEPTDFDSVIRRMGFECNGEIAVPPALKDEVDWAGLPCQTPVRGGRCFRRRGSADDSRLASLRTHGCAGAASISFHVLMDRFFRS
jgi:hypothetical protein